MEQRQLIGRECSQLFNLRQTLITDARGQHLITSMPAFDVMVHPEHIYTYTQAKAYLYVLFDTTECQFMWGFGKIVELVSSQELGTLTGIITIIMDLIYDAVPVKDVRLKCLDLFIYIVLLSHRAPKQSQPKIFGMFLYL